MKRIVHNDILVEIGENAKENDLLISSSEPTDYWFHLSSFPSPHVVVHYHSPDLDTIYFAANLCKENSKYRRLKNINVEYTSICNLRKTDKIGEVEYRSNRQVNILRIK